ncbi:hypothetical protein, partial [Staphylococcus epidermidis]|uniref:hypothetical protein n=1 Tax=Staphylococcus epidermidis TaxID=1282 RepID=UPI0027393ABE
YQGNIDFQTTGPATYVVNDVQWQHYGAALQIVVDDELRWVYVPYDRKNDFQFCESVACFTAMERSLDYLLRNSRVSAADAAACGISAGPEGLVLPAGAPAPHREPNVLGDAMATVPPPTPAVSNGDLQY